MAARASGATEAGHQTMSTRTYRCPICDREAAYAGALPALYPFCSRRCQLVDLGKWFQGSYTIDRDLMPEDIENLPAGAGSVLSSQPPM